jgi:hypothetical protein
MMGIMDIIKIVMAIISLTSVLSACGAGIANAILSGTTFEDYNAQIMRR